MLNQAMTLAPTPRCSPRTALVAGETKPAPSDKPFLFFHDQCNGNMRSAGQHGGICTAVAAALNEASGAPPLVPGATRALVDTGSQATCMRKCASFGSGGFGVTQMTPPTGDCGLPFALLDGGNGKHVVEHSGAPNVVTVEGGAKNINLYINFNIISHETNAG